MSLLVVGALHWDMVLRARRLPRLDETLHGTEVTHQFGGKGGNQAIAAVSAGARVTFAGRVGSDDAGSAMRARLVEAGMDVDWLQVGDGASGMSAAIVTEDGSYGAVIVPGENHAFDPEPVRIPSGCEMVLLQNEMHRRVLPEIAAKARRAKAHVILNAAPATGLGPTELAYADTLVVNRIEAADLLGMDRADIDATASRELRDMVPDIRVILTLGEDGAAFAKPDGTVGAQSPPKVDALSTHGAGDVFVGAYAAAVLRGVSMEEAVAAGQQAAADHISRAR